MLKEGEPRVQDVLRTTIRAAAGVANEEALQEKGKRVRKRRDWSGRNEEVRDRIRDGMESRDPGS